MEHHGLSLFAGVESITRGITAEGHEGGHIRAVIILMLGGHPDIVWDKPVRVRGKSGPVSFPENASEPLFILKIFGLTQCLCLMDSPYILSRFYFPDLTDVTVLHFDDKEVVSSFPPASQTLKLHV